MWRQKADRQYDRVRQRGRGRKRGLVSETGGYSKLFRICLCYFVAHYASSSKVYCVLLRISPVAAVPLPLPSAAVLPASLCCCCCCCFSTTFLAFTKL